MLDTEVFLLYILRSPSIEIQQKQPLIVPTIISQHVGINESIFRLHYAKMFDFEIAV